MRPHRLPKVTVLAGGILSLAHGASAQRVSAGVVAGASLTDAYRDVTAYYSVPSPDPGAPFRLEATRFWSPSKDYVLGGTFEVRFTPQWSLEVNGLFRQLHGSSARVFLPDGSLGDQSPQRVVTWEFPVLARCRFQRRKVNPFLEAGPSFRTTGNLNTEPSHHGIAAGAGFEMKWRSLKITPAIRYTHWARDRQDYGGPVRNQAEALVGFSF